MFKIPNKFLIFLGIYYSSIYGSAQDCPEFVGLGGSCVCSKCFPPLQCSTNKICSQAKCDSNQWANLPWSPSCEDDGSYSPKQCKGEDATGRCFCYNQDGKRIFGWSWLKDAENMTCACSRRREELAATRPDLSLHCSENDDGDDVGSKYWRQCESKKIARQKILVKLRAHGRVFSFIDEALCDGDGSFASYRVDRKTVFCTWKDSSRLENYQTPIGSVRNMNCNCARDTRIFNDEGLENLLTCETNGNYEALQFSNGRPFCVDSDGYAITSLGGWGDASCPVISR
ncbi:uncharacterized protein [Fopius arisanus]|uniref:Uncharacterized protein isoform X2 n=1 Tax=Fopius arisanus TaxID=64838 RepID=A0A9R1T211_9HYME|nr:PREDICTED: uncharacterized protein LOC105265566 isoform X2 [Fopius arisanus]